MNYDLHSVVTPVNAYRLRDLLTRAKYDRDEIDYLFNGFKDGFDIGYRGPVNRQHYSRNIPFSVGNKQILWEKIMKEVSAGRYAGPFNKVPFKNFIQSPIGLVPKAGQQTRLIFHLSYDFSEDKESDGSLNYFTPCELSTVHYNDLDYAVRTCIRLICQHGPQTSLFLAKSDLKSAFRMVGLNKNSFPWLVMKAVNPRNGKTVYFFNKVLPFGTSVSCQVFQQFSNSIKFLFEYITGKKFQCTNYIDDFLFCEVTAQACNDMVSEFLALCQWLNVPVTLDKTEWASNKVVFLGILLDGNNHALALPQEKIKKALDQLGYMRDKHMVTVNKLEALAGLLNFLNKAVVPGRAFTRRMYAKFSGFKDSSDRKLKKYHHVTLDKEFHLDCCIWMEFLQHPGITFRPMLDMESNHITSEDLQFFSDASKNENFGFGCVLKNKFWTFGQWKKGFIRECDPCIEFLELFGVMVGILTWEEQLKDMNLVIHCDNQTVCRTITDLTSSCKQCMILVRILALNNLIFNRKLTAEYVRSEHNTLADSLSRLNFKKFFDNAPETFNKILCRPSARVWPLDRIWRH